MTPVWNADRGLSFTSISHHAVIRDFSTKTPTSTDKKFKGIVKAKVINWNNIIYVDTFIWLNTRKINQSACYKLLWKASLLIWHLKCIVLFDIASTLFVNELTIWAYNDIKAPVCWSFSKISIILYNNTKIYNSIKLVCFNVKHLDWKHFALLKNHK